MIHIIYRTCALEESPKDFRPYRGQRTPESGPLPASDRTDWFDKTKCFLSLYQGLDQDCRLTVIHDGPVGTTITNIQKILAEAKNPRHEVKVVNVRNNRASLLVCYEVALADQESDVFYFVEDDYTHRPGWLNVLKAMAAHRGSQLLGTLYDHLDRYTRDDDVSVGRESLAIVGDSYWRTGESTTCTFFISRALFKKYYKIFVKFGVQDRELFRTLIKRKVRLWQPMPGYSTHNHVDFLAPFVDWAGVNAAVTDGTRSGGA